MAKILKKCSAVFMAILMLLTQLTFAPLMAAGDVVAVINGNSVTGETLADCISQGTNGGADALVSVEVSSGSISDFSALAGKSDTYGKTLETIIFSEDVEGTFTTNGGEFKNYTALKVVEFPQIGQVGQGTFSGCTSLEKVVVAKTQTQNTISYQAFMGCTSLKYVDIGKVQGITMQAFDGCTSLETVVALGCTEINAQAFKGCTNLKNLLLPVNVPKVTVVSGSEWQGAFNNANPGRKVIICDENGTPLSGDALKAAAEDYLKKQDPNGGGKDDDNDTKLWFGCGISGVIVDDDLNVTVDDTTVNAVISGTVKYDDGNPAKFVMITCDGVTETIKTDSNGNYSFGGTFAVGDELTVIATDADDKSGSKTVTIVAGTNSYTADIVIALGATGGDEGTIKVPVEGGDEGQKIPGIIPGPDKEYEIKNDGERDYIEIPKTDLDGNGNIIIVNPDNSQNTVTVDGNKDGVLDDGVVIVLKYALKIFIVDKEDGTIPGSRAGFTDNGTVMTTNSGENGATIVTGVKLGKTTYKVNALVTDENHISTYDNSVSVEKDGNGGVKDIYVTAPRKIQVKIPYSGAKVGDTIKVKIALGGGTKTIVVTEETASGEIVFDGVMDGSGIDVSYTNVETEEVTEYHFNANDNDTENGANDVDPADYIYEDEGFNFSATDGNMIEFKISPLRDMTVNDINRKWTDFVAYEDNKLNVPTGLSVVVYEAGTKNVVIPKQTLTAEEMYAEKIVLGTAEEGKLYDVEYTLGDETKLVQNYKLINGVGQGNQPANTPSFSLVRPVDLYVCLTDPKAAGDSFITDPDGALTFDGKSAEEIDATKNPYMAPYLVSGVDYPMSTEVSDHTVVASVDGYKLLQLSSILGPQEKKLEGGNFFEYTYTAIVELEEDATSDTISVTIPVINGSASCKDGNQGSYYAKNADGVILGEGQMANQDKMLNTADGTLVVTGVKPGETIKVVDIYYNKEYEHSYTIPADAEDGDVLTTPVDFEYVHLTARIIRGIVGYEVGGNVFAADQEDVNVISRSIRLSYTTGSLPLAIYGGPQYDVPVFVHSGDRAVFEIKDSEGNIAKNIEVAVPVNGSADDFDGTNFDNSATGVGRKNDVVVVVDLGFVRVQVPVEGDEIAEDDIVVKDEAGNNRDFTITTDTDGKQTIIIPNIEDGSKITVTYPNGTETGTANITVADTDKDGQYVADPITTDKNDGKVDVEIPTTGKDDLDKDDITVTDKEGNPKDPDITVDEDGTITIPDLEPGDKITIIDKDGDPIEITVPDDVKDPENVIEGEGDQNGEEGKVTVPEVDLSGNGDDNDGKVSVIIPDGGVEDIEKIVDENGNELDYTTDGDGNIIITKPQEPGTEITIKDGDGDVIDVIVVPEDGSDADKDGIPDNDSVTTRPVEDNRDDNGVIDTDPDNKVDVIIPIGPDVEEDEIGSVTDKENNPIDYEIDENGNIVITDPQTPGTEIVIKDKDGDVIDIIIVPEDGSNGDKDDIPDNGSVTTRPIEDNRKDDGTGDNNDGKVDVEIPVTGGEPNGEVGVDTDGDGEPDYIIDLDGNGDGTITIPGLTPGDEITIIDPNGDGNTDDNKVITIPDDVTDPEDVTTGKGDQDGDEGKVKLPEIDLGYNGNGDITVTIPVETGDPEDVVIKNGDEELDFTVDEDGNIVIEEGVKDGDTITIIFPDGSEKDVVIDDNGADDNDSTNGAVETDPIDVLYKITVNVYDRGTMELVVGSPSVNFLLNNRYINIYNANTRVFQGVTADANGKITYQVVSVAMDGYLSYQGVSVTVDAGNIVVSVYLEKSVDVEIPVDGGKVDPDDIVVKDPDGNVITDPDIEIDEDGTIKIPDLPDGSEVIITKPDGDEEHIYVDDEDGDGEYKDNGIELTYMVSGKVVDSKGNALKGVKVSIVQTNIDGTAITASATTDADGNYVIKGLPNGSSFKITASKSGYTKSSNTFMIAEENAVVDFKLIKSSSGGSGSGTTPSNPTPDYEIEVIYPNGTVDPNAPGIVVIPNPPTGDSTSSAMFYMPICLAVLAGLYLTVVSRKKRNEVK